MGRILAIDYGKKRVGLAVTDPLKIIAGGLTTVEASQVLDFLKNYVAQNQVELIVVGLPKTVKNTPSESMNYIRPFVDKLKKTLPDILSPSTMKGLPQFWHIRLCLTPALRRRTGQTRRLLTKLAQLLFYKII